jgi:hypothetical protein
MVRMCSLRHDVSRRTACRELVHRRGLGRTITIQLAMCQRFARAHATVVLAPPRSFLRHAWRELGQYGAAGSGGWGSGRAALDSHGRGRRFKTCHAHQPTAQVSGTILGTAGAADVAWSAVGPHWGHRTTQSL